MSESPGTGISVRGGAGSIEAELDDLDRAAAVLTLAADRVAQARTALLTVAPEVGADLDRTRAAARAARSGTLGGGLMPPPACPTLALAPLGAQLVEGARALAGTAGGAGAPGLVGTGASRLAAQARDLAGRLRRARDDYAWAETVATFRSFTPVAGLDTLGRLVTEVATEIDDPGGTIASDIGAGVLATVARGENVDRFVRVLGTVLPTPLPTLDPFGKLETLSSMLHALTQAAGDLEVTSVEVRDLPTVPTGLADHVAGIDYANPATVALTEYQHEDGSSSWVVHIPGTQSFGSGRNSFDMESNLGLMPGGPHDEDKVSVDSVAATVLAMERAGIPPGEPVLLVGHSQGGMIAASIAALAGRSGRYDVAGVVTVGSPTANYRLPDVDVLEIAHDSDAVPGLDGKGSPVGPRRTQVAVDLRRRSRADLRDSRSPSGSHAAATYARAAADLDRSDDPSVRGWRERVGSRLRLGTARTARLHSVQVLREEPLERS